MNEVPRDPEATAKSGHDDKKFSNAANSLERKQSK